MLLSQILAKMYWPTYFLTKRNKSRSYPLSMFYFKYNGSAPLKYQQPKVHFDITGS